MVRYLLIGSALGASVPVVLLIVHELLRLAIGAGAGGRILQDATLLVWPSSIFLLGAGDAGWADQRTWQILAISIGVNAILYGAIAAGVWIGIYRQRMVLVGVLAAIAVLWVFVIRL
jgi:hypothetical protein